MSLELSIWFHKTAMNTLVSEFSKESVLRNLCGSDSDVCCCLATAAGSERAPGI